ncbi:ABC transporter permease [Corynebacterium haemomassiliense]|uniref:ABC transporter permease n=1 Tax=Corynebacterium haemomassiliense TaxID=2754726 RepID=UPI0030844F47
MPNNSGNSKSSEVFHLDSEILTDGTLKDVNRPLSLGAYLTELWNRREFVFVDAKVKAFRTTRNYRWWRFWLVASPVLEALLYGAIFGLLLRTSRGVDNFVGFVIIGMTVFAVASRMLQGGFGLLEANRPFLQAFRFPQAAIVLSNSIRYAIDTAPSFYIAVVAAIAFQPGQPLRWTLLLVVPLHILVLVFGTGLMFASARLTASIPDSRALLDLFVRGWMFASGIFYPLERFATDGRVYQIFLNNPAYRFIDAIRLAVMDGVAPTIGEWGYLAAWSFGALLVGLFYFWIGEAKYAASL